MAGSGLDYGTDTDNEYDLTEEDQASWIEDSLIGLPTALDKSMSPATRVRATLNDSPSSGEKSPAGQARGIKSSPLGRKSYAELKDRRNQPTAMIEKDFIASFLAVSAEPSLSSLMSFLCSSRKHVCRRW